MRTISLPFLVMAFCLGATFSVGGCASRLPAGALPLREGPSPRADLTLLWVGYGACERLEGGTWVRRPAFDYEFSVEQRRYADHWESIKHLHRRHPQYDGSAGPRDETFHFRLTLGAPLETEIAAQIDSTLGPGEGTTDRAFRRATLVLHPAVSSWAPFDRYRIAQTYDYERGALDETVSLDKGDSPWVRLTEHATLFAAHTYAAPPTTR